MLSLGGFTVITYIKTGENLEQVTGVTLCELYSDEFDFQYKDTIMITTDD